MEGGTPNNYVYPTDPVNDFDLTGKACSPTGGSPYTFLGCKYNRSLERRTRTTMKWTQRGALVVGGIAAAALVCTLSSPAGCVGMARNLIRIGGGRISLGAAPKYYKNLPRLGKMLNPIHIHIEIRRAWIDLNWIRKGFPIKFPPGML